MRSCFTQHAVVYSVSEFNKIIWNEKYEIVHVFFPVPDFVAVIHYKVKEEFAIQNEKCGDVNIIIALCTTAYGRMKLNKVLTHLGPRCLYADTDSVFFVSSRSKPDQYMPDVGPFIGDFKSELESDNYIVVFVSAGAKNYFYQLARPDSQGLIEKQTIKGIKLDYKTKNIITCQKMKSMVECFINDRELTEEPQTLNIKIQNQFHREKKHDDFGMYLITRSKTYQFFFNKRKVCPLVTTPSGSEMIDTLPW